MIYVDSLINWGWRLGKSCHLIADSEEELVEFAVKIGLKPEWIQRKGATHFDLTQSKRKLAVKNGAQELGWKQFGEKVRWLKICSSDKS